MTTVALAGVVVLVLAVVHVPIGDYLARVFTDTWWWRVERASTGWCECPQQLHPSPRAPPPRQQHQRRVAGTQPPWVGHLVLVAQVWEFLPPPTHVALVALGDQAALQDFVGDTGHIPGRSRR